MTRRVGSRRVRASGAVVLGLAIAGVLVAGPVAAGGPSAIGFKVAIIVGPAGERVTPLFIAEAEEVARAAEQAGATVSRAYSPDATPDRVVEAVADAKIIVYFGHGNGFPSPYSAVLRPDRVNGWGLQGPAATGTHADSWSDGTLHYYGEAWLTANLQPAPGFVMIYSNACYTAGAPELHMPPASEDEARQRVENYARPVLTLGAAGYFASDFSGSAARLVADLLADPAEPLGDLFAQDAHFDPTGVSTAPHPEFTDLEVSLHRSADRHGRVDYWYAFAGDSATSLSGMTAWQWPQTDLTRPSLADWLTISPTPAEETVVESTVTSIPPHLKACDELAESQRGVDCSAVTTGPVRSPPILGR